jgi:nuclear pore complex protein Nup214
VLASMLSVVFSNGALALYMVDASDAGKAPDCCTVPPAVGVTCVSWSPKGKQLVAGRRDGTLTQFKPDLKEAKTIPAMVGKGASVISILWVSTYQECDSLTFLEFIFLLASTLLLGGNLGNLN